MQQRHTSEIPGPGSGFAASTGSPPGRAFIPPHAASNFRHETYSVPSWRVIVCLDDRRVSTASRRLAWLASSRCGHSSGISSSGSRSSRRSSSVRVSGRASVTRRSIMARQPSATAVSMSSRRSADRSGLRHAQTEMMRPVRRHEADLGREERSPFCPCRRGRSRACRRAPG